MYVLTVWCRNNDSQQAISVVDCWESFKQQQRIEKVNICGVNSIFWPEKIHKEMKKRCANKITSEKLC